MAIAHVGHVGSANNTGTNQSFIELTTSVAAEAGNLIVVLVAVDNNATSDTGGTSEVASIQDSAGGNTWTKAYEYTRAGGSAQGGAVCSVWFSRLTNQINSSGTIRANWASPTSVRDASAITAREYTIAGPPEINGTPTGSGETSGDPSSLNVTTSNVSCLRIRGCAVESAETNTLSVTASWTAFTQAIADTGSNNTSMSIRGEFRISTGTGDASNPGSTWGTRDSAHVYVAISEGSTSVSVTPAQGNLALSGTSPQQTQNSGKTTTEAGISANAVSSAPISGGLSTAVDTTISPAQGDLVFTATAPTLTTGTTIAPSQGDLLFSAIAPDVIQGLIRQPAQADLAFSTFVPSPTQDAAKQPAQADLVLSANVPVLSFGTGITPSQGNLLFSTVAPDVIRGTVRQPAQGDLLFSMFAPTVVQDVARTPAQANLVLSADTPTVLLSIQITPAQANLTFSTVAPFVAISIQPAQANLAFSSVAPTIISGVVVTPAQANLTLTSVAPTVTQDIGRAPAQADLTFSSTAPTVRQSVMPAVANLLLSGFAPTVLATDHRSITPAQGALTLFSATPQIAMNSYIFPDADVSDGTWTDQDNGTNLFDAVNDGLTVNDTDYIKSVGDPINDICVLGFSDPDDILQQPFDIMYRYKKTGPGTIDLTVRLLEGATEIAAWTHNGVSASFVDATQTLTNDQFLAITDTNNLRIEFKANAP